MSVYRIADEISVKIKNSKITTSDAIDYDQIIVVEILAEVNGGYVVFLPSIHTLKNSFILDKQQCKRYCIPERFADSNGLYVLEDQVFRLHKRMEGCCCNRCKEFCHLAEPNCEDGKMICYACRCNPYR